LPVIVNVQAFALLPPLEQAPDQIASRPFVTLSVIDVPVLNDAVPVLPTLTLMPTGLDVTRSPLRPDAVTVNVAACAGGVTVSTAVFVTLLELAEIVTAVDAATPDVAAGKVALVAPAATVTLAGTVATAVLLLASDTRIPPAGAAALSVAVPVDPLPPATDDGFTDTADRLAAPAGACGMKRHVDENGPKTPAAFRARTRHHRDCADSPVSVTCDAVTVGFATNGAAIVDVSST
jgi:hypothetical protein